MLSAFPLQCVRGHTGYKNKKEADLNTHLRQTSMLRSRSRSRLSSARHAETITVVAQAHPCFRRFAN